MGGGTVINAGLLWRTPPWILDEWESNYNLDGYGLKELEPHFNTIEKDLNVVRHRIEKDSNLDSLYMMQGADNLGWKYEMAPRALKDCKNTNYCITGCPTGAKQSMLESYLPRAVNNNATIFSGLRAIKIEHSKGKGKKLIATYNCNHGKREISIKFKYLFVCCGSIQTPFLLYKSGLGRKAGKKIEFHWSLKIVARFKNPVYAGNGTVFTAQLHEFAEEGTVIMPSNFLPNFVTTTIWHKDNNEINNILYDWEHYASYVTLIRPESKGSIFSKLFNSPLVYYNFDKTDFFTVKKALRRTLKLLFSSGASLVYLPIIGWPPIQSLKFFDKNIDSIKINQLELTSVHAMASCPMGISPKNSVVNPNGKLWNIDNIYVADASVLPTNIGESPQGTIMAFSHEIVKRHLATIN